MADEELAEELPSAPPVAPPPPSRKLRKWLWIALATLVVVPILVFGLWSFISLTFAYSEGERAGYVQKFSSKGWLCKTWEGELSMVNVPGQAQERWFFSVRNDSVAQLISAAMGTKVALQYAEHRGVPTSCFGETDYYVKGIRHVPEP